MAQGVIKPFVYHIPGTFHYLINEQITGWTNALSALCTIILVSPHGKCHRAIERTKENKF